MSPAGHASESSPSSSRACSSSVATIVGPLGGQRVDRRAGLDLDAELSQAALERVDQGGPAADQVARRGRRAEQHAHRVLPDEGGGELAGVVVEGVDAGGGGEHRRGALVAVRGRPAAEVDVDRRFAAAQAQHRRDRAERRRAARLALPAEADAGQRRAGVGRQQIALGQPVPERAVLVDDVGAEVGLVGAALAAGAAAEPLVRLEQAHPGAAFGAGDRRGEAGEAAADDRDPACAAVAVVLVHDVLLAVERSTLRANWLSLQFQ